MAVLPDDEGMDSASVDPDGRVRLDDSVETRAWPSLGDLVADYWRYQRLPRRAKASGDMAAWTCVYDLVSDPAWDRALDLIDALIAQASAYELGDVGAGPLEELVVPVAQGPRFITELETRARRDRKWATAIAGLWLDRNSDPDVNSRLALFGAHYPDGTQPD